MKKRFYQSILAALFLVSLSALSKEPVPQQLHSTLKKWCQREHIAGASLSIYSPKMAMPHTIIYGTLSEGGKRRVARHTLFQIGDITKTYIATLTLLLASQKQFTLLQQIGSWFPEYKAWRHVTIKQLLNMTSGIPSYTENAAFNNAWHKSPMRDFTSSQLLGYVKDKPLRYQPGHGWNYSDTNYILLGEIIQKATGLSVTHELQEQLFIPLQLFNTYYLPHAYSPFTLRDLANAYTADNQNVTHVNMSQAGTAGAMVATTADVAKFYYALFAGDILRKQQMLQMMTPYSAVTGQRLAPNSQSPAFGLGINREWKSGGYIWFKPGATIGQIALVAISSKKHVVIAISANKLSHNAFVSMTTSLMPDIYHILLAAPPV